MRSIAVVVLSLSLTGIGVAQEPNVQGPTGLMMSFAGSAVPGFSYGENGFDGNGLPVHETREADVGYGVGMGLGWGFTRWLALYGRFDLVFGHDSDDYEGGISTDFFEAGARLSLPLSRRMVPYANLAYSNFGMTADPTPCTPYGLLCRRIERRGVGSNVGPRHASEYLRRLLSAHAGRLRGPGRNRGGW